MWPWWVLQASITVATVTVARKKFMVWRSAGYIRPVWVFLLHSFKLPGILALCSKIKWPGVAGASGAVARAPRQPHHVTTWLTPRHPHASRPFPIGDMLVDPPLLKGAWFCPIVATPSASSVTVSSLFPTHPHLSVALRRLGACGPGHGRARASLWGGLPCRVPPGAWSRMRPPRCGPRPARLSACGNHRSISEGEVIWKEEEEMGG